MPQSKIIYLLCSLLLLVLIFSAFQAHQLSAQENQAQANPSDSTNQVQFRNTNKKFKLAQKESEFYNSVCFENCHQKDNISPKNKTVTQWKFLIQQSGHSIFAEIPWKNSTQKKKIFQFLIENAKGTGKKKEGIGVWD